MSAYETVCVRVSMRLCVCMCVHEECEAICVSTIQSVIIGMSCI